MAIPFNVSDRADLAEAVVSVGLAKTGETINTNFPLLQQMVHRVRKCRVLGSAALDLAYVACGRLDAYIEQGISLWDIAAGWLLVENAGGTVDLRPREDMKDKYSIIASNGVINLETLMTMSVRCGIGYDVHRLVEGRKLILGGVEIAHSRGLEGHSDADVLSHAIADALLGAIGAGDIGQHFPNTDESIRGISSIEILKQVSKLLAEKKARVLNIDATIIAEEPKIAPHVSAMRKNIASAIDGSESDVSIKATTNERLGAIGRSEGIAAMAVASVEVA